MPFIAICGRQVMCDHNKDVVQFEGKIPSDIINSLKEIVFHGENPYLLSAYYN